MAEHTPGLWSCDTRHVSVGHWSVDAPSEYWHVASVNCRTFPEAVARANAALIAASPLLLAACEAEDEVDRHSPTCDWCANSLNCDIADQLKQDARQLREIALVAVEGDQ